MGVYGGVIWLSLRLAMVSEGFRYGVLPGQELLAAPAGGFCI